MMRPLTEYPYYNFQGIRISKPEPGMPVIERRGDSVVKTIAR